MFCKEYENINGVGFHPDWAELGVICLPLQPPVSPFASVVLEKIRSAVGSAQLLMSQKVQQFYRLCQQNMVSESPSLPSSSLFKKKKCHPRKA